MNYWLSERGPFPAERAVDFPVLAVITLLQFIDTD